VAGGDYLEDRIAVDSQAHLVGGWSGDFAVHDPETYVTRLRGVSGTLSFNANAGDHCGVSHMTFHDCQGWSMSEPVGGRHGAAIVAANSSPTIANCVFENNRAHPGLDPGWGGAVMAHQGSPTIRDCRFENNIASHGGALALSQCDEAVVERCQFIANATADSTGDYAGAGIFITGGSATIDQCELRGGGSSQGGGLAVVEGAVVVATDVVVTANRAVTNGAGVSVDTASLTMLGGEVLDNVAATGNGGGLSVLNSDLELRNVRIEHNQTANLGGGLYAQSANGTIRNSQMRGNQATTGGGAFVMSAAAFSMSDNVIVDNNGGGLFPGGVGMDSDFNLAHGNVGGDFMTGPAANDLVADPLLTDADAGDFAPGLHSPLVDTGSGLGGVDWDGGSADRGLFGGAHGAAMAPGRVTSISGDLDGSSVTLNWAAVDGADSYVVYRDSAAVFVPAAEIMCATVADGSHTCQDILPDGDAWYYVVAALDAQGHLGGFSVRYEPGSGSGTPVDDPSLPAALAVTGIAPNPFNPRATVNFAVPQAAHVSLKVFDMRGRLVTTLVDDGLAAGRHTATWDGTDRGGRSVAAGVYLVRVSDGVSVATQKALLAK